MLPSKRLFRAFQAEALSFTQPSSLFSCARTVMRTDPWVMKNRAELRLLLAFQSLTFVRLFRAKCPVEDVKNLQHVENHCLSIPAPHFPTRGDPLLDAFPPSPLAEIDRAFALADVVKCSVKSSGGIVRAIAS